LIEFDESYFVFDGGYQSGTRILASLCLHCKKKRRRKCFAVKAGKVHIAMHSLLFPLVLLNERGIRFLVFYWTFWEGGIWVCFDVFENRTLWKGATLFFFWLVVFQNWTLRKGWIETSLVRL